MESRAVFEEEFSRGIRLELRYSYKEVFIEFESTEIYSFKPYREEAFQILIHDGKVEFMISDFETMYFSYCGDRPFRGETEWFLSWWKREEEEWLSQQLEEAIRLHRAGKSFHLLRLSV